VTDDADQGVTDVVRGEDLADNTARQILLQRALGLPTPTYLHTPLVRGTDGDKLSKQNGATALQTDTPADALAALDAAARVLGLRSTAASSPAVALALWIPQWRDLYNARP
jgi:glutamyl-Q tRNA(Asp) synthetase